MWYEYICNHWYLSVPFSIIGLIILIIGSMGIPLGLFIYMFGGGGRESTAGLLVIALSVIILIILGITGFFSN